MSDPYQSPAARPSHQQQPPPYSPPYSPPGAPPVGLPQYVPQPAYGAPAPLAAPAPTAPAAPPAPAQPATRVAPARVGMSQGPTADDLSLDAVLIEMIAQNASDLHLTTGAPPMVRMSGSLRPLGGFPTLSGESLQRTIYSILTQKQREKFEADLELDFAYAVRGHARFRVNLYQQRDSVGAAFRVIPYEIKPLEDLGVPPIVGNFANLPRGLVLVTGPTGSGKSTTLASIVDLANRTREDHIMTVEDPIEFLHRHKKSLINQREVGTDTHSFANALKHVLRQDPDIILVGEMRDLETISVALTAAETGHLVFATLHTQDAAQTIDRVIDVFPSHQQAQVRTQLAGAIQGVVSQTLCKRADGPGRVVATEVMVATPAIRNLIREGKTHQIYSAMQAGAQQGMHTMDQQLAELVKAGRITHETGIEKCHHIEDFNRLTGRLGGGQGRAAMGGPNYGMQGI
ncbi:type IV pilus twitching motility protein PilT [Cellulomonas cellasea]|uniref:type IV pilus twitching motility protein PilT n=1 Tax=Cellulomonas cellasea TaxID=43670 RepID=UPI0025A3728B|nr:type IV pilus twitching motility protein PilT [Cellulomonas cellasea]MDM8083926.1 type IV pilus twitching motility protein PilT [Cellulomonas cellasea]